MGGTVNWTLIPITFILEDATRASRVIRAHLKTYKPRTFSDAHILNNSYFWKFHSFAIPNILKYIHFANDVFGAIKLISKFSIKLSVIKNLWSYDVNFILFIGE